MKEVKVAVRNFNGAHELAKLHHVEGLSLQQKIEKAESLIRKENEAKMDTADKLRERKSHRDRLIMLLKYMPKMHAGHGIHQKRNRLHYLEEALHEQEHNEMKSLYHKLQCGRISLAEERKIQREIKCAEEKAEKLLTDGDAEKRIPWGLEDVVRSKKSIKIHKELLHHELRGLKEKKLALNSKEKLNKELDAARKGVNYLEKKLEGINRRKGEIDAYILELQRKELINLYLRIGISLEF